MDEGSNINIPRGTTYLTAHEMAELAGTTPNMIHTYIRTNRIQATTITVTSPSNPTGREIRAIELQYALQWATTHKAKRQERIERQKAIIDSQLGRNTNR